MTIGENIKRIRKEKGLTQKKLGELCGIAESNIRKYENGKQNPKIDTIQKIAVALGIDPFSLYSFDMASKALENRINQKESDLLNNYRQLNTSGQQKANNYIEDLTKIPEYQKKQDSPLSALMIRDSDSGKMKGVRLDQHHSNSPTEKARTAKVVLSSQNPDQRIS